MTQLKGNYRSQVEVRSDISNSHTTPTWRWRMTCFGPPIQNCPVVRILKWRYSLLTTSSQGRRALRLGLFSCSAPVRGPSEPPLLRIFLYAHGTPAVLTIFQPSSAPNVDVLAKRPCPPRTSASYRILCPLGPCPKLSKFARDYFSSWAV